MKKADTSTNVAHNKNSVRATISFPAQLYAALEAIAEEKKVSLAWVVRDATERYVSDRWPLFREPS